MNIDLISYFEETLNNKKLKKSRLKRKLSIREVSEATGIPETSLQRYEDGKTKKVPVDVVKTLCKFYGTDYRAYYGWSTFPLFGTVSGILLSFIYGLSIESVFNGSVFGSLLGFTGMLGAEKLFNFFYDKKKKRNLNNKEILYMNLTESQKQEFERLKTIYITFMNSKDVLNSEELEELDSLLLVSYVMHIVCKRLRKQDFKINELEEIEQLEDIDINKYLKERKDKIKLYEPDEAEIVNKEKK